MGLFGSKKTYVSSTIYNLAGPIADRPNFLKTLLISHVLGTTGSSSFPQEMQRAYASGPGNKLRGFGRWARDNYRSVGVPRANLYSRPEIDAEVVAAQIIKAPNETVNIQRLETGLGDYAYWAEQWMFENEPELIDTNWETDYNETSNTITITFESGGSVDFVPNDFRKSSAYIFAVYTTATSQEAGPLIEGETVQLSDAQAYPSIAGWETVSGASRLETVQLSKITQETSSFSDGRPNEVKTTNTVSDDDYEFYRAVFEKSTYAGAEPGVDERLVGSYQRMSFFRDGDVIEQSTTATRTETIEGDVTKTITTKVDETVLMVRKSYRIDTQEIIFQTTSRPKMFIYRLGSGNSVLDKSVTQSSEDGFYFPFIPVRLDNKMISAVSQTAYDESIKAYKKATGADFDELIADIQGNKDVGDIDYAYVMFGVSLNTKEETGKKYLFDFFENIRLTGLNGSYASWAQKQESYGISLETLNDWREGQQDTGSGYFGEEPPALPGLYSMPMSEIRIKSTTALKTNLDIQISWQSISKTVGTGLGRAGAKPGDCWLNIGASDAYAQTLLVGDQRVSLKNQKAGRVVIHQQVSENTWEALTIIGLNHKNFIYNGKFVEIDGDDALTDAEESGFLVPLHYPTFKAMSLKDSTQLSSACCYLVINSYLVKKTGFFQSTFFKIFLVIAVVAITVATGGAGAGSIGLLGANAAVGAAIGLSGLLGIIAGAIANAIAAMIVTQLISMGATAVFGEKFGAIIGAIVSVVALQVGTGLMNGSNLSSMIGSLAKADSIIAMTNAVGGGVAGYIRAGAQETMLKIKDLQEDYAREMSELNDKYQDEFGYGRAMLDPLSLTNRNEFVVEGLDTFLERTLMTGSDVAEMSMSLLSNFTEITLSTELPL